MRRGALAALAVAVALSGACGGATPAGPELPPPGASTFVGRSEGVAASVDLAGVDATARAVAETLRADGDEPVAVAIASILNERDTPVRTPRFLAVRAAGADIALVPARDALAGRPGAAARAARASLPPPRRTIAADGTAFVYLVLRGARPADVVEVRMRLTGGDPVALGTRRG